MVVESLMNKKRMNLYSKLEWYQESDFYGFHMPGHKRNEGKMDCHLPYEFDITEIDGFDDLHHARGILKEAQVKAALLYGADETHYLINGSTSGVLSAILGSSSKGDKILIGRNCHKSVYHAIYMNELKPVYVYPDFLKDVELNGSIKASHVKEILQKEKDIKAVMLTSPTYDGVVSDIREIADIVHEYGIPVIVDEAHGAHFGFHSYFPQNSNYLGADVIIHSLHKTLPALTQCALIHMNGPIVDRERIRQYLHMLQTSSPSYVLMASMDVCLERIAAGGSEYFDEYVNLLDSARFELKKLNHLRLIESDLFDKSKIIISVKDTNLTSHELYERLLKQYHLQMEMRAGSYVIAMTSVGDTKEGIRRLVKALNEIDLYIDKQSANGKKSDKKRVNEKKDYFSLPRLQQMYSSGQLGNLLKSGNEFSTESKIWSQCVGCVSVEYAYVYPPGIPMIVPGEVITEEAMVLILNYKDNGFSIEGLKNEGKIEVLVHG